MSFLLTSAFSLLTVLSLSSPLYAIDTLTVTTPDPVLESWRWTIYSPPNGPTAGIAKVYMDRDGVVWVGTWEGIWRYDGYRWSRFEVKNAPPNVPVNGICQTRDGAMWFGIETGVSRYDLSVGAGQAWTTYILDDRPSGRSRMTALLEARDGTLWAGLRPYVGLVVGGSASAAHSDSTVFGGIWRFDGEAWVAVDAPGDPFVYDIQEASDGSLWFMTFRNGVLRYDPSLSGDRAWTRFIKDQVADPPVPIAPETSNSQILYAGGTGRTWDMTEAGDGSIWFARASEGVVRYDPRVKPGAGSSAPDRKTWKRYPTREVLGVDGVVSSVWFSNGNVWAGGHTGIARFADGVWTSYARQKLPLVGIGRSEGFAAQDGTIWLWTQKEKGKLARLDVASPRWAVYGDLPSANIGGGRAQTGLFVIGNDVWLGGPNGTIKFDGKVWTRYTSEDGIIDGGVSVILQGKDGHIWLAGWHQEQSGAARYDGKRWRIYSTDDGLVGLGAASGFVSENGDIWLGTLRSGAFRFDGRAWTRYTGADGLLHNRVMGIAQTPDRAMWFSTRGGVNRFHDGLWTSYTREQSDDHRLKEVEHDTTRRVTPASVAVEKMRVVTSTRDGAVWAGQAAPAGGFHRFDGTWRAFGEADGIGSVQGWKILEDRDGWVWLGRDNGLVRFDPSIFDSSEETARNPIWTTYSSEDVPIFSATALAETFTYQADRMFGGVAEGVNSLVQTPDGALWLRNAGSDTTAVARFVPDRNPPETFMEAAADQVSSLGNILIRWSAGDLWGDTPEEKLRYQWRINEETWSPALSDRDVTADVAVVR